MSLKNRFEIKYRLLTLQETCSQDVSLDYYLGMPPEYFVDAEIDFYLNGKKFFSDNSFCKYKFVLDTSFWFKELFPNYPFIWNEERFDGWLGTITIQPQASKTLFKVNFDYEEDKKDEVEVYIPTKIFSYGFAKFINSFKEEAESFWGMSFNLP
ncbi:MAG: hypothetical protein AAF378_24885 [Cyanobacteria bacterium P01_A01_bin.84]